MLIIIYSEMFSGAPPVELPIHEEHYASVWAEMYPTDIVMWVEE